MSAASTDAVHRCVSTIGTRSADQCAHSGSTARRSSRSTMSIRIRAAWRHPRTGARSSARSTRRSSGYPQAIAAICDERWGCCLGLRDVQADRFEGSAHLLAIADALRRLKAIVRECGRKATMNLRVDAAATPSDEGADRDRRQRPLRRAVHAIAVHGAVKRPPMHGWIILDKPRGLGSTQAVAAVKRVLREARLRQGQGRPRRHARSAGDGRAADRARRGDQACRADARREQDLCLHDRVRRGDRHARPRRRGRRHSATRGPTLAESRRSARASPARSSRFRRPIRRSRSMASAPTIWRGRARRWSWSRAGDDPFADARMRAASWSPLRRHGTGFARHRRSRSDREASPSSPTSPRAPISARLARDIAHALGTVGHVTMLRRTQGRSVHLETRRFRWTNWTKSANGARLEDHLLPLEAGLDGIPALTLDPGSARRRPARAGSCPGCPNPTGSISRRPATFPWRWWSFRAERPRSSEGSTLPISRSKRMSVTAERKQEVIKEQRPRQGRHRLPRSPGRDPHRAHPQPDRALQGPRTRTTIRAAAC